MKYTVLRKTFLELLTKAGLYTSYKIGDIESLRGVYIDVKNDGITTHTTNITDYFRGECGGKVEKTGVCLVDYKTIFEVLKSISEESVTCEVKETFFSIKTKKTEVNIPLIDHKSFPLEETFHIQEAHTIKTNSVLPDDLSLVLFSSATDETRPILTGVYYEFDKQTVTAVSTDGFRLSMLKKETDEEGLDGVKFVIPSKSILNIEKTIQKSDIKRISLSSNKKRLFWEGSGVFVATRIIDGEYPPYKRVIPPSGTSVVVVSKKDLVAAFRTVSLFTHEGSSIALIAIEGEKLIISSPRSSSGSARTALVVDKKEGNNNEITFNTKYIQAFLSRAEGNSITFEMTDPTLPGVFRVENNEDFLHIIMPIRPQ